MSLASRILAHRRRKLEEHLGEVDAILGGLALKPSLSTHEQKLLEVAQSQRAWLVERLRKIGEKELL